MDRKYTSYQMRVAASSCDEMGHSMVAAMLRQAADMMDRADTEKRDSETLRALVEGLIKASSVDCASCGYDCGPRRENCIIKLAIAYLEGHS